MTTADTRVTVRNLPWYGTSTELADEQMTSEQALDMAGLSWEVDTRQLFYRVRQDGKERTVKSAKKATVRMDTFDELGVVGAKYHPFQNHEAFAFLDSMSRSSGANFQAAGSMNGGSRVFVVMKFPETVSVLDDPHDTYVLFMTSHDGSMSVTATTTMVRLACTNMFRATLTSDRPVFKAAHIGSMMKPEVMAAAASETLGVTADDQKAFTELAGRLADIPVASDEAFDRIMKRAMPWDSKATAKEIEGIRTLWTESETINDAHRYTGWGLANATTEYLSHFRASRSEEAKLKRALGVNGQIESRLATALLS